MMEPGTLGWLVALGLAIGVGDLMASTGLGRRHPWLGPVVGGAAATVAALATGWGLVGVVIGVVAGLTVGVWHGGRHRAGLLDQRLARPAHLTAASARVGVGAALIVVVIAAGLGALLGPLPGAPTEVPFGLVGLAAVVLQLSTGNAVVRLVLAASGADVGPPEPGTALRGGRIIGPLERLVVLGLLAVGELAAAGVLVAAKGLLRYPELSRSSREDPPPGTVRAARVEELTEYLLIGTLTSFLLAFATAALFGVLG